MGQAAAVSCPGRMGCAGKASAHRGHGPAPPSACLLGGRSNPTLLCETEEQNATRPEVLATARSTELAASSP